MPEAPYFSIIMPAYNRASMIDKAIESIIKQTFPDWELIIIDDASEDNTEEVVRQFNEPRIVYLKNISNIERSASRNKGIDSAKGEFICFLDSDDYFKHNRLEILFNAIEERKKPVALFYTDIIFEKEGATVLTKEYSKVCKDIYERIILEIIGTPQVCIHRNILAAIKFNEKYNLAEDLDLWTRIAIAHEFIYIQSLSVVAVEHSSRSINSDENHFLKSLLVVKNIFNDKNIRHRIKRRIRHESLSTVYYKIGLFYFNNSLKYKSLSNLLRSFFLLPFNSRTKHILTLIFSLIFK